MANPDIIVVGASHGGVQALSRLVARLPENLPAAVFVVLHSAAGESRLDRILSGKGPLPAILAEDGEKIKNGTIYVARPNRHLLVKAEHVATPFGPRENRFRPSIDVLFRSAAASHTTRVVAVLLTGYLDDGVVGLAAVNRCGGTVIVQDPDDADAPELPKNAIRHVAVDHLLAIDAIADRIVQIVRMPVGDPVEVPEDIMEDIRVSEHKIPEMDRMEKIGEITPYTCPECGGVMWHAKNEPIDRLVCHTGHSFTMNAFLEGQAAVIENSLWAAIRFMDERIKAIRHLAEGDRERNRLRSAEHYEEKIKDLDHHRRVLRDFIVSGGLVDTNSAESA